MCVCVCVCQQQRSAGHLDSTHRSIFLSLSLSLSLAVHAASPKNLFLGQKIYDECDWLTVMRVIEEDKEGREEGRCADHVHLCRSVAIRGRPF